MIHLKLLVLILKMKPRKQNKLSPLRIEEGDS